MRRTRQYAAAVRRRKPASELLLDRGDDRVRLDTRLDAHSSLSAPRILSLQHTIGNRAVQRLIVQRDARKRPTPKKARIPPAVASVNLVTAGELKGDSTLAGHEGKIEVEAVSIVGNKSTASGVGGGSSREGESSGLEVVIVVVLDSSFPGLLRAYTGGDLIDEFSIDLLKANENGGADTTHSMNFKAGYIVAIEFNPGGGGQPLASLTIQFNSAEFPRRGDDQGDQSSSRTPG
jgi:type VI protein secretion system component Hcp